MNNTIEFEVIGIAEVIKRNKLMVPPNQREYSWLKDTQVKDLLFDINNAIRNPNQPYFLGTIVLTRGKNDMLEIADGQQRLATTTMILASIRDWYKAHGDYIMVQSIENDFLFTIDRKDREKISKLTLNLDDNEYFRNTVIETKKTEQKKVRRSHKLIAQAFYSINDYIKNIEKSNGIINTNQILNDWIDYLSQKANIVKLVVSDAENAFMMFETLNDRGLKTSQVDLVKNHLFKISDNRLNEAQRLWSSMRSAVETVTEGYDDIIMDFLRGACCIISGLTTKKEVMKKVQEKTPSKSESIKIMTLLEELSKDYAAILNPDHQKWNDYNVSVRKSIQAINLFGVSQIRPLMLAIARFFNKENTASSFKKIVAWSVRFMVLGLRGGRLDEGYSKLAHAIFNGKIKNTKDLKIESERIIIKDTEFKKSFETLNVRIAKLARYYLRSLETTARNEQDPEFIPSDEPTINLEHIMPDSLGDGWKHINSEDFDTYFSRIGNLALLQAQKNLKIGNKSFKEKCKTYKNSTYLLTSQLYDITDWNIDEIENRQKILAELAVKTWPL
ncbi:MAG: DUF262 domain-containing protein [Mariniphaga sp.]|nr:DUF262 domain-containing protein [Mariniphaga sp.]